MKIVALAGGVGGAKLVHGLAQCLNPDELSVIVNTGDDFEHFGLYISPDLDTVCYTLAGLANPLTGWGRENETWHTLEEIKRLGGISWFNLGDLDLATHLERTRLMKEGNSLSEITTRLCQQWNVRIPVYPMSNSPVQTFIHTRDGKELVFQEYFVKYAFEPPIQSIEFRGIGSAKVPQKALDAIKDADCIIICPSNPFVSIDPILSIDSVKKSIRGKRVLAVSPLIAGKALKGPAAKMFRELGIPSTSNEVARHYRGILTDFILDNADEDQIASIEAWGIMCRALNIFMPDQNERKRLASEVLTYINKT